MFLHRFSGVKEESVTFDYFTNPGIRTSSQTLFPTELIQEDLHFVLRKVWMLFSHGLNETKDLGRNFHLSTEVWFGGLGYEAHEIST